MAPKLNPHAAERFTHIYTLCHQILCFWCGLIHSTDLITSTRSVATVCLVNGFVMACHQIVIMCQYTKDVIVFRIEKVSTTMDNSDGIEDKCHMTRDIRWIIHFGLRNLNA